VSQGRERSRPDLLQGVAYRVLGLLVQALEKTPVDEAPKIDGHSYRGAAHSIVSNSSAMRELWEEKLALQARRAK
jgi:hypothetical protein